VLVDLRAGPGYGRVASTVLHSTAPELLFIPVGIAHGFLALEDQSLLIYKTSTEYAQDCDTGILWNSIPFDWNLSSSPTISDRDRAHQSFSDFVTPF
jgi:dTDP-4-dehydrorhamnose 3,5-epimerase/CDP-3, 6-dideoxy-D-glycero-D-glycero-4-hexulose-5-epimerase